LLPRPVRRTGVGRRRRPARAPRAPLANALPPRRHVRDGKRPRGGGRRGAARIWRRGAAGRRRIGDAGRAARQHERAHDRRGRARRRPDPRAHGRRGRGGGDRLMATEEKVPIEEIDVAERPHWLDGPPHELFKRMRAECPVHWTEKISEYPSEAGFWSVTKADDIHTVSRDWETYSSEKG